MSMSDDELRELIGVLLSGKMHEKLIAKDVLISHIERLEAVEKDYDVAVKNYDEIVRCLNLKVDRLKQQLSKARKEIVTLEQMSEQDAAFLLKASKLIRESTGIQEPYIRNHDQVLAYLRALFAVVGAGDA